MEPRGVIFDFDGVILDTEVVLFRSWIALYERYGSAPPSLGEWVRGIGSHERPDPMARLVELTEGAIDAEEAHHWRVERSREMLRGESALPGVEAWLSTAKDLGLAVGIASNSSQEWVERNLRRLGLLRHFDALSCFGPGLLGKPSPDLYVNACRLLGIDAAEAVAVEDSPSGVAAARAAGVFCVAVPNELTAHVDLTAADLVVPSLAALPLRDLVTSWSDRSAAVAGASVPRSV
ncbi:HAD family phosphatase [Streptomyces sp. A012304]|uniref:HAD family hydrolase n=1 Tax=Streptomyces sp. A012304 TaxID=375446 RepID=UPI002231B046|nr:HAD family phosphatase [Streptomyces sp. A012304]GKQ35468.1 haloacid dehalogenase [Streptomyces sp. A012304]